MSDAAQDSSGSPQSEKPKRNPKEKLIVWGVIGLGLLIACTEGTARFGYSMSLKAIQDRVHDDEGADANPLTITEAEKLIVGFPKKEVGADQVVTFRFKGLVKEFGAIHLKHDDDDLVLGLKTDAPPEDPEPPVVHDESPEDPDFSTETEMSPPGEEGSPSAENEDGGGQEKTKPTESDKNEDNKESPEEVEKPAETDSTPATEPEEAAKEE